MKLPAAESFTVEYVTNKSWSGYNWYQGQYRSLIQVNTDLPVYIDRAIDLACHEGYPGHHVYNALLEQHLVRDRGWVEFTVYPLFSPQSLIAEGTANYGIEVAFPGRERVDYERSVLFPAAGLDPARAAEYYEVQGTRRGAVVCGQRGRQALSQRWHRSDGGSSMARAVCADVARSREATRQILRSVPQLRRSTTTSGRISWSGTSNRAAARRTTRTSDGMEFGRLLSSPRLPSGLR